MRATDIIRGVLDLIDQVECAQETPVDQPDIELEPLVQTGIDTNRFKHVFAMLSAERASPPMYDNSPNSTVADITSVTKDAGGGWNGPKNLADLRADSVSMYPGFQAESK